MMAKPTAIVVWFDDNTRYHIDPAAVRSLFINEAAAARCGHKPPHAVPGPAAPVKGPFNDTAGPPAAGGGGGQTLAAADAGTCYYVNGMIICP
ncbi:MAG TPA: hypothetical protein VF021_10235 [Longimicrobiales bacterium]